MILEPYSKTIIGVDPGSRSGAIAFLYEQKNGTVEAHSFDLPTVKDGKGKQINAAALAATMWKYERVSNTRVAFVENVHSMPKQGVASSFRFGKAVGIIEGVITALKIPMKRVAPVTWMRAVIGRTTGGDTELIRAAAVNLFPEVELPLIQDHNRAAALLIAEYGRTH